MIILKRSTFSVIQNISVAFKLQLRKLVKLNETLNIHMIDAAVYQRLAKNKDIKIFLLTVSEITRMLNIFDELNL